MSVSWPRSFASFADNPDAERDGPSVHVSLIPHDGAVELAVATVDGEERCDISTALDPTLARELGRALISAAGGLEGSG